MLGLSFHCDTGRFLAEFRFHGTGASTAPDIALVDLIGRACGQPNQEPGLRGGSQSFLSIELPNEIYYMDDGKALDAVGVPPDIHMRFFTPDDLQVSRDAALDEAIRQLTNSSD